MCPDFGDTHPVFLTEHTIIIYIITNFLFIHVRFIIDFQSIYHYFVDIMLNGMWLRYTYRK